jgi:hypothetical protein
MRKLLTVAALLAASTLTFWQPKPAMAAARVEIVIGHYRHPHYHYYYRHHYRRGYYGYYR